MKKIVSILLTAALVLTLTACSSGGSSASDSSGTSSETSASSEALKIGIPDDATNGGRAIKLLETAGLIEVDPDAGWTPELKDITAYLYNIEIVPAQANTLPSTLGDYAAAAINGTYAIPVGLVPSEDGLIIESQEETSSSGENPYVNIIAARSADKDNETYQTIVEAFQTDLVGQYIVAKYQEAYVPAFDYTNTSLSDEELVQEIDNYSSSSDGKTIVKVGVCGASNEQWNAVQKVLDDENAGIYIELVEFDAYNLPNQALNNGDIDLNSFQHKAYLENEVESQGYEIESIGDTLMAPLTLYSSKYNSLDELKQAAGKVE